MFASPGCFCDDRGGRTNFWRGSSQSTSETWVRSYEPELKRQFAEWRPPGSPLPVKFRQEPSSVKLMLIAAYVSRGIVLTLRYTWPDSRCSLLLQLPVSAPAACHPEEETTTSSTAHPSRQCSPSSCSDYASCIGVAAGRVSSASTLQP